MKKMCKKITVCVLIMFLMLCLCACKTDDEPSCVVSIAMQTEEEQKTTDDGIIYLTRNCTYPVVSIEGNENAAEKINTVTNTLIESLQSDTFTEQSAREYVEYSLSENPDTTVDSYMQSLSFRTARADNNVISFAVTYCLYEANGYYNYQNIGINFDTTTGDQLTFTDLSDDPDSFIADAFAYYNDSTGIDASSQYELFADSVWYLSTYGLVSLNSPYAAEFIIPYSALSEMGFDEAYAYTDKLVVKLSQAEKTYIDINGDKSEDSVLFYDQGAMDENNNYYMIYHLIINDVDFAQGDNGLNEYLPNNVRASFSLYDLNTTDQYLELVFYVEEVTEPEYNQYSIFFRYTEDGSLVYLGRVDGDVTDPTVSTAELESSL